jgi:hypothetical protein
MSNAMISSATIGSNQLNDVLVAIATMGRDDLIEQFHSYPAPFPIDFTDAFLQSQSLDKLRHVFAGLVMHCRIAPQLHSRAS